MLLYINKIKYNFNVPFHNRFCQWLFGFVSSFNWTISWSTYMYRRLIIFSQRILWIVEVMFMKRNIFNFPNKHAKAYGYNWLLSTISWSISSDFVVVIFNKISMNLYLCNIFFQLLPEKRRSLAIRIYNFLNLFFFQTKFLHSTKTKRRNKIQGIRL